MTIVIAFALSHLVSQSRRSSHIELSKRLSVLISIEARIFSTLQVVFRLLFHL